MSLSPGFCGGFDLYGVKKIPYTPHHIPYTVRALAPFLPFFCVFTYLNEYQGI